MDTTPSGRPGPSRSSGEMNEAALQLVRGALLSGVLLFGGVVWWLHSGGKLEPRAGESGALIEWLSYGLSLVALVAAFVIRAASGAEHSFTQRTQRAIMAWALGESAGLLGGVHFLLTGVWRGWVVGALVTVATMILVPVPRRE